MADASSLITKLQLDNWTQIFQEQKKNSFLEKQVQERDQKISTLENEIEDYKAGDKFQDSSYDDILSIAISPLTSVQDVLKRVTEGTKRYIHEKTDYDVEVSLFEVRNVTEKGLDQILQHEELLKEDLVVDSKAIYCLFDTFLGEKLGSKDEIERYILLKEGTVLGETERFGESVVSVKKLNGREKVKHARYGEFDECRRQYIDKSEKSFGNEQRVSFPIYSMGGDDVSEIEYIMLIRNKGAQEFTNDTIREMRNYVTLGSLGIAIKELDEKNSELVEKDHVIEELDQKVLSEIRGLCHDLAAPLGVVDGIVELSKDAFEHSRRDLLIRNLSRINDLKSAVYEAARRAMDLISKHHAGEEIKYDVVPYEKKEVVLDQYLSSYVEDASQDTFFGDKLNIKANFGAEGWLIKINDRDMNRVLNNIFRNIYQRHDGGESKIDVNVMTAYKDNFICFFIRDDAGGMSDEQMKEIEVRGKCKSTTHSGDGDGVYNILNLLKEQGCKNVEPFNIPGTGFGYIAYFPATGCLK